MPTLTGRIGTWELENVQSWSERELVIRAPERPIVTPQTVVATIGSCFAAELAEMMTEVGLRGAMHPGGLFYSTATIRQELERMAGGWPEREQEPPWRVEGGLVDPFRDYYTVYPDEAQLLEARQAADRAADDVFRGAGLVVVTLGLIETWRSPVTSSTYRQIPHPSIFPTLGSEFHRLTVAEMVADLERIRRVVRERLGAEMVVTTSPVPLHATFTALDVRVANMESKSRIRAAVSEFVERYPDVRYFHSYDMVMTAERQSDYFLEDGRHVHRHAVRYIVSEFLRLFADPSLRLGDADASWLTPIDKTAATPAPQERRPHTPKPPPPLAKQIARRLRRGARAVVSRRRNN